MPAINFIGIPLFILLAISILALLIGLITHRRRLASVSLYILIAAVLAYLILFLVFR